MSTAELEAYALSHLESCALIHRYHAHKSPLPISHRTVLRLRKKLFANILSGELSEDYADAAQRVLSASAKALERKEVTAEGRVIIEVEKAQEVALVRQGFRFQPAYGDFIKVLGRRREHWLCLFLNECGEATATLSHYEKTLAFGGELGRWTLPDLADGLANALKEAEQMVANLLAQGTK